MQGMIISVYRTSRFGNCTNGPTATTEEVLLVGDNIPQIFNADGRPVFKLKKSLARQVVAVPVDTPEGSFPMFGGNFLSSSDSRFSEAALRIDPSWTGWTIPVFDRDETKPFDHSRYFAFTAKHEERGICLLRHFAAIVENGVEPESAFEMVLGSEIGKPVRDGDVYSDKDGVVVLRPFRVTPLTYQDFQAFIKSGVEEVQVTLSGYRHWAHYRGDLDAAVIYSQADDASKNGESGYWNEKSQSWGGLQNATRYSRNERRLKLHMPRSKASSMSEAPHFIDVASIMKSAVAC